MRRLFGLTALVLGLSVIAERGAADDKKPSPPKSEESKKAEEGNKADKGQSPPMSAEMEAAYAKAGTPGPEHEMLKSRAGSWTHVVKFRMAPDQEWMELKGTSERKVMMGGRYVQQETKGAAMMEGQPPFEGFGVTGYDNIQKKYVNVWFDNEGTGMMISYGTADPTGKVITYAGEYPDAMTGKVKKIKSITRMKDDKTEVYEMYDTTPDGKEYVTLEVTYTKK